MPTHSSLLLYISTVGLFLAPVFSAQAGPFGPIIELFRLGPADHLVVDRGGPVDNARDVNGDGLDDIIVGTGVGGIRVIFGPTNGDNGFLNAQQTNGRIGFVILNDSSNDSVLSGVGDINADGIDDVLVGSVAGTHVIFGKNGNFSNAVDVSSLDGSNGFSFLSPSTSVSRAGDVNGDGIEDIIVGNANATPNSMTGAGVTYVIYGRSTPFPAEIAPVSLNGVNGFAILGNNIEARSGLHVGAAGDFNGDGIDDVLIGAPNKTQGTKAEAGEAYLVLGSRTPFPPAISLSDINGGNGFVFTGSNIQDSAGAAVAGIGDLNHDGVADIAIGAPGKGPFGSPSDYPGEIYVLFGGRFNGAASIGEADLNGLNGMVLRGVRGGVIPIEEQQAIWGDLAGTSIDSAGDINHDGIDDLVIGASHTIINPRRKGVGQTYFVYGSASAFPPRMNLADLDGNNGFRINGIGTVDYFGVYVSGAGDFNADGRDDVIIGASGQGHSYVIYGRDGQTGLYSAATQVTNGSPSTGFPESVLSLGADAPRPRLSELRDPTGPNPFPVGTSTILGDPATPGNRVANASGAIPAVRPSGGTPQTPQTTDQPASPENPQTPQSPQSPSGGPNHFAPNPPVQSSAPNQVKTGSFGVLFLTFLPLEWLRRWRKFRTTKCRTYLFSR